MSGAVMTRVVSSAYVYTFELGTVSMMLFMYRRKKVVDNVLPCGMPCVMICDFDCACCVCVDCSRFEKYDLKKAVVSGVKLYICSSLWSRVLCDIVSYAFDKSMYMARVGDLSRMLLKMLLIIVCSASVVLELGLNAYCVGEMMLCFVRWVMTCSFMMVSNIFAMMGSSEIGR
jgi:hypothetical protein